MSDHARLSPSNLRWPVCPGSVREEAKYPDIPGEAAIDGTGSHLLLEMCMKNNVLAIQYDQQIIGANHPDHPSGWLVGVERANRVQMCLDYIARRVDELKTNHPGCTVTVESETKSNPGALYLRDDWWGTVDITIICRNFSGGVLFIEAIDYKDGRVFVHVVDNTQLLSYLGGKVTSYFDRSLITLTTNCRMTIVQPKTNPVVRYQCSTQLASNFSIQYLMEKLNKLHDAAELTDDPNAPLVSGKHCQWCKHNPKRSGSCVTAVDNSLQTVVNHMNNTELVTIGNMHAFEYISKVVADPKSLTSEQLSELFSAKDALMTAFDRCGVEIQERIEAGQHVSGYEMSPGKSSRIWNESEKEIVKKLKSRRLKLDDIYPKKLVSVAALLKCDKLTDAQKKKVEDELVSTTAGNMILKKVAHSVAQTTTNNVQSSEQMFAEVPTPILSTTCFTGDSEISFF